jgi:hypothetical protein
MAYERNGDSGIDNVANTRPPSRPRATGVAAVFPAEAVVRDYEAAKLRATPMTERLYAPPGLRDLGRILESMAPAPLPARRRRRRPLSSRSAAAQPAHIQTTPSQTNEEKA